MKYTLSAVLAATLVTGCVTSNRLDQNRASGREIIIAIGIYSQDALDTYPTTLSELVSEKLIETLPRCRCEDGRLRDFTYVPGLSPSDGNQWVILTTPVEMDSSSAIIFYPDVTMEIVTKERALLEISKTKDYIARRNRNVLTPRGNY